MVELCGDLVIRVYNSSMTINTPTLFAGGSRKLEEKNKLI
jgi:hypothetical protein